MASFLPPLFNPKFENAPLKLHPPNFVRRKPHQKVNRVKKFSPTTEHLATIQPWRTERRQPTQKGVI